MADMLSLAAEANRVLKKENKALREQVEALQRRLELVALLQENQALGAGIDLGVSKKGCVSVYNLQSRPVSLYKDQWQRVLAAGSAIQKFIKDNDDKLITI